MVFSKTADANGFAEVDVTSNRSGAGVEPMIESVFEVWIKGWSNGNGSVLGPESETYQSMDWGGSSFEGEVLTVSTQPRSVQKDFSTSSVSHGRSMFM